MKLEVVRDYGVPLLPPHEGASATIVGDPLPAARTAAAAAATGRGPLSGEPGGGGGARGSGAGSESEVEGNKGGGDEGGSAPEPAPLPNAVTVRKAAGALLKHRDTMPLVRRRCAASPVLQVFPFDKRLDQLRDAKERRCRPRC